MSNADLVKRMRLTLTEWALDEPYADWWSYQHDHSAAADAIAALEAEVARLQNQIYESIPKWQANDLQQKLDAAEARAKALEDGILRRVMGDNGCGDGCPAARFDADNCGCAIEARAALRKEETP